MAEERLELVLRDRDRAVRVSPLLVLLPAETDPILEEGCGKRNLSRPRSSSGNKIVLTLLTEVVAVHVGLSAIYIRGTGLQLFPGHLGDGRSWDGNGSRSRSSSLHNGFKNPLQVILGILEDTRGSNRSDSNGRFRP